MSPKYLESDHILYLIWRYLQESGPRYARAADQLRRDWDCPNSNPENLPFAQHVHVGDLVRLVLDGLEYDRQIAKLDARRKNEKAGKEITTEEEENSGRKHRWIFHTSGREHRHETLRRNRDGSNGLGADRSGRPLASKRAEKSTGPEMKDQGIPITNGFSNSHDEGDAQPDGDELMMDDGPVLPVSTLETGASAFAQTEMDGILKPAELNLIAEESLGPNAHITHIEWSPVTLYGVKPPVLFIGGDNAAFCYTLPKDLQPAKTEKIQLAIGEPGLMQAETNEYGADQDADIYRESDFRVTAAHWDYRGVGVLAGVREPSGNEFLLSLCYSDGNAKYLINADPVASTCLSIRQNASTKMVLVLSAFEPNPETGQGCIQIWSPDYPSRKLSTSRPIVLHNCQNLIVDGDWIDHSQFVVANGETVELWTLEPKGWTSERAPPTEADISDAADFVIRLQGPLVQMGGVWDIVRCIPRTHQVLCFSQDTNTLAWADAATRLTQTLDWDYEKYGNIVDMKLQPFRANPSGDSMSQVRGQHDGAQNSMNQDESCWFAVLTTKNQVHVYDALSAERNRGIWSWFVQARFYSTPFQILAMTFKNKLSHLTIGGPGKVLEYDLGQATEARRTQPISEFTESEDRRVQGLETITQGQTNGHDNLAETELMYTHNAMKWSADDCLLAYAVNSRVLVFGSYPSMSGEDYLELSATARTENS
ncbi:MAG: hypothetical protein M1820_004482 [Bogoriella megaspora]|nr:MAG: hypothetical protein M1820_004482 [Bogoriella megaspora]